MKNKILIVIIIIFVLMLIPIPLKLKDGGSVEYKSLLYSVTKIHRINHQSSTGYEDGWKIEILGIQIYNKTNIYVDLEKSDEYEIIFDLEMCLNCYKKVYEFEDGTKIYSSCPVKYKVGNVEIYLHDALDAKLLTLSDLENVGGLKIYRPTDDNPFGCSDYEF